jgi:hypothetical protein
MKIMIKGAEIDMDLYEHYIYQPDFNAIFFVVKRKIADFNMQIPLIFRTLKATKEAFCRMNMGRHNGAYSVSLSDIDCIWHRELGDRVTQFVARRKELEKRLIDL